MSQAMLSVGCLKSPPDSILDLLNNDHLINDVLESNDLDFDLWDIENLQPPPNEDEPRAWQVPKTELKQEPAPTPALTATITRPTGIVVTPVTTFQPQLQPQQLQHPQLQPVQTTIVSSVESPTIRNLLTRDGRVQDLISGQKIIFHPIGSNVAGNTILLSNNGQPLLLQVGNLL